MVQASATAQIDRALRAKTTIAGERLYKPNDLVDYHRPPPSKDVSGWHGLVPVISNHHERGKVICRIQGRDLPCRYPDVRHTLLVMYTFLTNVAGTVDEALSTVLDAVYHLQRGGNQLYGYTQVNDSEWKLASASREHPRTHLALDFVIRNSLRITGVGAARIGRGTRHLRKVRGYTDSIVLCWP